MNLDFWWREFSDEDDPEDGVFISDDAGVTWYPILSFNGGPYFFRHERIDLAAAAASYGLALNDQFQIKFQFYDDYSISTDGYAVDQVQLLYCTSQPTGQIEGYAYDANTGLPLDGAMISTDNGPITTTDETGFYQLLETTGQHTLTATIDGNYGLDVQTVTVVEDTTVRQDFNLPAGRLAFLPSGLEMTLDQGQTAAVSLTLSNTGGRSAAFEITEKEGGFNILQVTSIPFAESKSSDSAEHPEATDKKGLPFSTNDTLAAGDVIRTWPSGLASVWGIVYDGQNDTVWAGLSSDTTKTIYEYTPDGTLTGRSHPYLWNPTNGPADSAFNWNTGMLWTLDTSNDRCLHEMDPATGYTSNTLCGPWTYSQLGLAYDPTTDTWYTGGTSEDTIYHIDSDGVLLDSAYVGLNIYGLAYNPDTQHLFVQTGAYPDDTYVLDASQPGNYPQLNQFHIGTLVDGAGLEIDCEGNLWAVDRYSEDVYQVESGEVASLCSQDVPWLSEAPITGTISAASHLPVTITFDAGSTETIQPGQYTAQLKIDHDTPYRLAGIPVTMTVNPAPSSEKLTGLVTGLGHCDTPGNPLDKADIFLEGGTGATWSLTTAADGQYAIWLDEAYNPLTATVSYAGYLTRTVTGIRVTDGLTTTVDVDLRSLQPCVNIDPSTLSPHLALGQVVTQTLTIANTGAFLTDFKLAEADRSFGAATHLSPNQLHSDGQTTWSTEDKKDNNVPEDHSPTLLASGDPDPYGYTYRDSSEANGPTYQWIEIAPPAGGSGIEITGLTGVDDGYFWPLTLPFDFNFYGTDYTQLALSSNGTLYFQNDYLSYSNWPIPSYNYQINSFIAHLWDDLVIDPGAVYYQALDSKLIIEYYQVRGYSSTGHGTWQVILFDNGNILFQYQDVTFGNYRDYGGSATVGIQSNSTTGLQYSYNTSALSDGLAICLVYPGQAADCARDVPWLSKNPTIGSVAADSAQTIEIAFDAGVPEVTQPGAYFATLIVSTQDPTTPRFQVPVTMTVTSYGVDLFPATATASGDPGSTIIYTLQVNNTGLETDTFEVVVAGNSWPTTVPGQLGPLTAGTSAGLEVMVTIPADATGGASDTPTITVTSQSDPTQFDTAQWTTTANNIYGLRMGPANETKSDLRGATVTYTLHITNSGNTADTFVVTAEGNAWPVSVSLLAGIEVKVGPLAAGTSDQVDIIVPIPLNAPAGATDTVTITLTSEGDSTKSAAATLTTVVDTAYGVQVAPTVTEQAGDPGTTVTCTLQVTNTGLVADTFDIAPSGNNWTTTAVAQVGPLTAGASDTLEVVVTIPTSVTAGASDTVTMRVTSQGDNTQWGTATLTTTAEAPGSGKESVIFLPLVLK